MPATRTKVLLVDDHDLIRKGLRHAFERDRQFEVVGEAATAAEAVRQAGALHDWLEKATEQERPTVVVASPYRRAADTALLAVIQ